MPARSLALALLAVVSVATPPAAQRGTEMRRDPKTLASKVVKDVKDLATAPRRWHRHEWRRFGEGSAIVLAAYATDDQIVRAVSRQQNPALNTYLRDVTHLGGSYGLELAGLMAATGYFTRDDRLFAGGFDALESSVIASGIITPVIKRTAGRARPIYGLGKHAFDPFNSSYQSFPSGHATNAFALASAIAARYDDNRVVLPLAYALATSVAIARVHDRMHFASDVLSGAMIGHAVAKSIVTNHRHAHMAVLPTRNGAVLNFCF